MNQISSTATESFIITDAMWARLKPIFSENIYKARDNSKMLEAILHIADSDSGWKSLTFDMAAKPTLQKYIHMWINNGTMTKVLASINRGANTKVPFAKVKALLDAAKRGPNKKVPVESVINTNEAIEQAIADREYTPFIKAQILEEVKKVIPSVQARTVTAYIQKRIRYGTLHGVIDGWIYQPYPQSMAHLFTPISNAKTNITEPVKTVIYKDAIDNVQDNEVTYKYKEVKEVKEVKENSIEIGWKLFLEVYAKAHWTQKKKMAQKIRNWLVSN